MKRLRLVHILWQDAHAGGGGWQSIDTTVMHHATPHLCQTVGWVIHTDRDSIIVAQNRDPTGDVADTMTIPLGCIRRIRTLK